MQTMTTKYASPPMVELAGWRSAGCGERCEVRLVARPTLKRFPFAVEWRGPLICGGIATMLDTFGLTRRDGCGSEDDARDLFAALRCNHP